MRVLCAGTHTQHGTLLVKTSAIFEYSEYAKLPERKRVRGAGQNVSLLTCFILEDHTNKLYDLLVFFNFFFFFKTVRIIVSVD